MALKAWYPLNMDTANYGSGNLDLIQTAAPTYVSGGKTGANALNRGGFKWSAAQTASVLNNDAFSYACWIKPTPTTPSSDRAMIFGNSGARQFSIFQYNTANDLHLYWYKNGVDTTGGTLSVVRAGVLPSNVWTHVAVTYSKATGYVCIYINGSLNWSTSGIVISSSSYEKETQVIYDSAFHQLNDVRIYDHCLSQLEVSEIYETLVLHYPLNRVGPKLPYGNLYADVPAVSQYTISNPYTRTTTATDGAVYLPSSRVPVDKLTTYRIQCSCDGVLATSHSDRAGLNKFTLFLYVRNEGTTKGESGYDSALNLNSTSYSHVESAGNRHTWYYTTASNVKDIGLRTNLYSDGTTKVTMHFWDFSFSRVDTEITDCSGRMSQAIYPRIPTMQNDSHRYSGSIDIDGANNKYITNINDPISANTSEFSISMWFRANSVANNQCLWNGRQTVGAGVALFLIGNKIRFDDSIQTTASPSISANTWYHLVVTWKSGGAKILYLDGSEVSNTDSGNLDGKTNWMATVGRSSDANNVRENNHFTGAMSDIRVYMTQLSASRVSALYSRGAAVDPGGHLSCAEVVETGTKTQLSLRHVNTPSISELDLKYDGKLYVEPDGSMWVRIVRQNNPASYRFTQGDAFESGIYRNSGNTWANLEIMNLVSSWEFMVKQKRESTSPEVKYRWLQYKNPLSASFADVGWANITKNGTEGYASFNTGGIYKVDGANTYLCTNNGTSGNWWGALCAISGYQGGIPGWGDATVETALVTTGYTDLYIRIDSTQPFSGARPAIVGIRKDDGTLKANEIREM